MLRIAELSVHTCPLATLGGKETGGMNVYVRDLSRELLRRGHHVDVYTRSQDATVPHITTDIGRGGRVIHVPAGPEEPYSKHLVYDHMPEFIDGVLAQAHRDGITYDVIHSHYWLSGYAARALQQEWNAPIVHMAHTLGKMKNQVARSAQEEEPPRRIHTEEELVHAVDCLIAATPAEQEQLVTLYGADPGHIRVIPPGVDTERFYPIPTAQAKEHICLCSACRIILFVGRIEPLKGIDTLLWAISLIARKHPELTDGLCVSIIGGNPYKVEDNDEMVRLQTLRRDLGIGDVVTFMGAQDQDTLPYYYASAEMVVMPSDYESFGMVALEAMACGTPVIASDVGGLAHLVQHGRTGYRVPTRDPGALAAKIARLLTDTGLRMRMGHRAACWAEGYTWPLIADRLEATFADLLDRRTAHTGKNP
ncbi:MAG: glycosyltransferase [Anaerolineae bacterium]|nr:glycosyltransferase [Anaerolineae bacterium]